MEIPILDFRDFLQGNAAQKRGFVEDLKTAFETTGFFYLKNHAIPEITLRNATKAFKDFFALPETQRIKYEFPDEHHQRGYTPMRIEKGEFAKIADEKHFFQLGDEPQRNVNVEEIERFKICTNALFSEFRHRSCILLEAIALSLGLDQKYFSGKEGNSVMRAIDYPPNENPLVDDSIAAKGGNIHGMCASKHTDINMITLLEAQEEGLQLLHHNQWLPITIRDPKFIIVNAGDMLEHLTGGRYKSGLHRVVCKKNVRRFSIPFFCHLKQEESIVPLAHLGPSDLNKYPFRTAGKYLDHRLVQIGI